MGETTTPEQFRHWLRGYLEGRTELTEAAVERVREELARVAEEPLPLALPSVWPSGTLTYPAPGLWGWTPTSRDGAGGPAAPLASGVVDSVTLTMRPSITFETEFDPGYLCEWSVA